MLLFFFNISQLKQAGFYDCIMKQMRFEPEYFRVGYYGMDCPHFLEVSTAPTRDDQSLTPTTPSKFAPY